MVKENPQCPAWADLWGMCLGCTRPVGSLLVGRCHYSESHTQKRKKPCQFSTWICMWMYVSILIYVHIYIYIYINFAFDSVSNLVSPSPTFLGRCGCWRSTYSTVAQRWCSEGLRFEPGRAVHGARDRFFAATRQCFADERNISKQITVSSTRETGTMDRHGIIVNQFSEHEASLKHLHPWVYTFDISEVLAELFNFHSKNGILDDLRQPIVAISAGGFHSVLCLGCMVWGTCQAGGPFYVRSLGSPGTRCVKWSNDQIQVPTSHVTKWCKMISSYLPSICRISKLLCQLLGHFESDRHIHNCHSKISNPRLDDAGQALAFGCNDHGQCNISLGFFASIQCGRCHTLCIRADGWVEACGANEHGQCDVPASRA